jgi:hypothetical protein
VTADHQEFKLQTASNSTVGQVLAAAQIKLGDLDEVEPALPVTLSDGAHVKVTRVNEEFYTEQIIIPFIHQELSNDALPTGERLLSQPGTNGLKEITHRRVYEDGIEVSNTIVNSNIIQDAIPEIEMIGSHSIFAALPIPGKIAYLSGGNAWIIEGNTSNQKLEVSTGDLDGRIFSLSKDGNYLIFTRFSSKEQEINTLWIAVLSSDPVDIINLGVRNIVHFAEIDPNSSRIAFSTSEWREASPGWQANNDLYEADFNTSGLLGSPRKILGSNSGGVYGWWGTEFGWALDGSLFLFARPDSIGIIDDLTHSKSTLLDITPYQSGGNWAWVPSAAWSPDGKVVYTIDHVATDTTGASESDRFDLIAISLSSDLPVTLIKNVGMFAYPLPSPIMNIGNTTEPSAGMVTGQADYRIAYLQALHPEQSESSEYKLYVIDRSGKNFTALFPQGAGKGILPQHVAWSPSRLGAGGNFGILLVYNGNIWMIDAATGEAQQVTGDGLSTRVDWR